MGVKAYMVKRLNNEKLRGRDFLGRYEATLDFKEGTVTVRDQGIEITVQMKAKEQETNHKVYDVATVEESE